MLVAPASSDRETGKAFVDHTTSPTREMQDEHAAPLKPAITRKKAIKKALNEDPRITGALFFVIIFSTICFILESHYPAEYKTWNACEAFAVAIFTLEYVAQLVTDEHPLKYATDLLSVVDLLAILPFYIDIVLGETGLSLSFLRAVRLFRVFRVAKLGKGSAGIKIVLGAFSKSAPVVALLALVMLILIILFAALMVMVEGQSYRGINSPDDCYVDLLPEEKPDPQCVVWSSIPNAFWWAAVTMFTVGYGDAYPQSQLGKTIAAITMFAGILFISQPLAVVGANFQALMEVHREDQALFSSADRDGDGMVGEEELMEFLHGMRHKGKVPDKFNKSASVVLKDFDIDTKGWLNQKEFNTLTEELIEGMDKTREPTPSEVMNELKKLAMNLKVIREDLVTRVTAMENMLGRSAPVRMNP